MYIIVACRWANQPRPNMWGPATQSRPVTAGEQPLPGRSTAAPPPALGYLCKPVSEADEAVEAAYVSLAVIPLWSRCGYVVWRREIAVHLSNAEFVKRPLPQSNVIFKCSLHGYP
jgi:hypothetical protein